MTRHATNRLKERGGIPKRAAEATLADVTAMMPQSETGGRFRRYLDHQSILNKSHDYIGNNDLIYIVRGESVVTVLTTPQAHRKQARIQLEKWKKENPER